MEAGGFGLAVPDIAGQLCEQLNKLNALKREKGANIRERERE